MQASLRRGFESCRENASVTTEAFLFWGKDRWVELVNRIYVIRRIHLKSCTARMNTYDDNIQSLALGPVYWRRLASQRSSTPGAMRKQCPISSLQRLRLPVDSNC